MKIYLDTNTQARLESNEVYLMPLYALELEFCSNAYSLDTLIISVRNGDKNGQFKLKKPFKIDLIDFVKAGVIEIQADMVIQGKVVKTWYIPSLYIKEVIPTFEVTPEIAELRLEIDNNKRAINELVNLLKENNII